MRSLEWLIAMTLWFLFIRMSSQKKERLISSPPQEIQVEKSEVQKVERRMWDLRGSAEERRQYLMHVLIEEPGGKKYKWTKLRNRFGQDIPIERASDELVCWHLNNLLTGNNAFH